MTNNLEQFLINTIKYFNMVKDTSKFRHSDYQSPEGRTISFSIIMSSGSSENYIFTANRHTSETKATAAINKFFGL